MAPVIVMQRVLTTAALLVLLPCLAQADRAYDFTGEPLVEPASPVEFREADVKPLGNRIRILSYNIQNFTDGVGEKSAAMPEHVKVLPGVGHMKLAFSPEVYAHVRAWCAP